jgi:transposase
MNLKIGKSNGRDYLSIVHGYRDPVTHQSKTKTIESLGYLEDLKKQYNDPVAHYKKVVEDMKAEQTREQAGAIITVSQKELLAENEDSRKNFGYAALSSVYHGLGMHTFINNHARGWNVEYNANNIVKVEVFSRILSPGSKKKTHEERLKYFENVDYSLDDVYRCLSRINQIKESFQLHMHKKIRQKYGRNTELVYYDVTNYFFEIDEADEMRRKGVSKEHRPNPIVQMGLFMDTQGIPIAYKLFAGNTLDCETLVPFLTLLKRDYELGRVIVVADKGLNTSPNIVFNVLKHDGYVYSQTVRGANKEMKTYVLDEAGYEWTGEDYKKKSRIYPREIYVTDKDGKKKKVPIDEKQVIFYSREYDKKAKAEREPALLKAMDLVNDTSKYNRATSYGAAKYVKNLIFDKKTGEILTADQKPIFDEEKVREEEKYDGFYAIVTSEIKKTDSEVIEIYRGLWKIEETFKVTKSDLETRPVYLSREDHIQAHFLICFVALVISRIMERELENRYPITRIAESLNKVSCSPISENWYVFDYSDDITKLIFEKMGIDMNHRFQRLGDMKKIIAFTKKN